jgi:hypothetical protein
MIEYNSTKCEQHNQVRCAICQAMAAKGSKPGVPKPAAPSQITGEPPADLEGLSVRDRIPATVEEANTDYDKIVAEVNEFKQANAFITPGQIVANNIDFFATLPVDDSHASKVLRAAAAFAEVAAKWARVLATTERIKKDLLVAQATLDAVTIEKNVSELELKKLVSGE